jgi:hypothetical protein
MSTNASVWRTTKTDTLHTAPLRAATARKAASALLQSGGWVVIQAAGPRTCAASNISEGCRRFDQRLGAVCVEVKRQRSPAGQLGRVGTGHPRKCRGGKRTSHASLFTPPFLSPSPTDRINRQRLSRRHSHLTRRPSTPHCP